MPGRIRSERRGRYWLNWGGHVFAGPGSSTDALLNEAGISADARARRPGRPVDERQAAALRADADLPLPHPPVVRARPPSPRASRRGLGERVQLDAEVVEIVHGTRSVVVRYRQGGLDREVEARCVALATPATVSHRVAVDLPQDLREALGAVRYGPYVSPAFLTSESTPQPWDAAYGIATPKRSFNIVLNQSSIVRGRETVREPGSSIMAFSPA